MNGKCKLVLIFKRKGYARNCNAYREVKLLKHALEIVETGTHSKLNVFSSHHIDLGIIPQQVRL